MLNFKDAPIKISSKMNVSNEKQRRKLMIPIRANKKISSTFVDASGRSILSVSPPSGTKPLLSPNNQKRRRIIFKNKADYNP